MKIFFAILFLAVSVCCKKKQTPAISGDPYPPLAEQRATLSKKPYATPVRLLDSAQIISSLQFLSSDECEGRKPGNAGHQKAMDHLINAFRVAGADSFKTAFTHAFTGTDINGTTAGYNLLAWVTGTEFPDRYLVVTAHYDHVGIGSNGAIYHGADDNASGASNLPALAKYFKANPLPYSIIFVALDREETGLEGAYALVKEWKASGFLGKVWFNLNMDMIARSDKNEIFACGINHYPQYRHVIDSSQNKTNVKLLMGHDGGDSLDDWTSQSDHNAFYKEKIPFIYMGVEDHPDYHKPTDTFDKVDKGRYIENCNLIATMIKYLEAEHE